MNGSFLFGLAAIVAGTATQARAATNDDLSNATYSDSKSVHIAVEANISADQLAFLQKAMAAAGAKDLELKAIRTADQPSKTCATSEM